MDIGFSNAIENDLKGKVLSAPIFIRWMNGMVDNFEVDSILIHNVFMFGDRVGFIVAEAKAFHEDNRIPGIVFLRGDSVSIMPVFTVEGYEEKYTAVVTEPRAPIARKNQTSLPAGMIDGDTFMSAAIKELAEEVGEEIHIKSDDLIELGKFPLSCGGCDEYMSLMAFEYNLDLETFRKIDGRQRGVGAECENIHVRLIPLSNLIDIPGLDARSALSYYIWKSKNN